MAMSTTDHKADAPTQKPTPGVARQGDAPAAASTVTPQAPTLPDDMDPVLLVRLYPEAVNNAEARGKAMAAGAATAKAGAETVASQNEPVITPAA
jgi:hypothetical protein